jgi:hypothetical protein
MIFTPDFAGAAPLKIPLIALKNLCRHKGTRRRRQKSGEAEKWGEREGKE